MVNLCVSYSCRVRQLAVDEANHLTFLDAFAHDEALLAQAEKALSRVKSVSDDVAALHQKVTELVYAAQDAAEEARDVRDELTYSAEELEQIEQRLDVLHKLKRKYGASVEDVLAFLEQARSQLDEIEFASDKIERLRAQLAKQDAEVQQAGLALREARDICILLMTLNDTDP